jgi:DNA primase
MMELNKIRRQRFSRQASRDYVQETSDLLPEALKQSQPETTDENSASQESEIIRILLNYGDRDVELPAQDAEGHPVTQTMKTRDILVNELMDDGIGFDDELLAGIFSYFSNADKREFRQVLEELKNHREDDIRKAAVDFLSSRYNLDDWERKGIYVKSEEFNFHQAVLSPIYHLKLKRVLKLREENRELIRDRQKEGAEIDDCLQKQQQYDRIIADISKFLGVVVVR